MALCDDPQARPVAQVARGAGVRSRGFGASVGTRAFVVLAALLGLVSCDSRPVIATFRCPESPDGEAAALAGGAAAGTGQASERTLPIPWSTGFENGWCDFADGRGDFVESGSGEKALVTKPVHSGAFAASFSTTATGVGGQSRVIRAGLLPAEAYYGAWYYIPSVATNTGLWNLIHFQNDNPSGDVGLWDVSVVTTDDGNLRLEVYCPLLRAYPDKVPSQVNHPPVPIGSWFHIEIFWKRAMDDTGVVRVYQDGEAIFQLADVVSDTSVNNIQWYVGNLADSLVPKESTVYVDDITIQATSSYLR